MIELTLEEAKVMMDKDVLEAVKKGEPVFKIEQPEIPDDPLVSIGISIMKAQRLSSSTQ